MTLCSPLLPSLSLSAVFLLLLFVSSLLCPLSPPLFFYLVHFSLEPWDSLSGYVHSGIACLAFRASDWAGAFWTSLSGYPPLLGAYPSMTFCETDHDWSLL